MQARRVKILSITKKKDVIKSIEFLQALEKKISDFKSRVKLADREEVPFMLLDD